MLFRRVKKHVAEENWFSVGVDLLIVIVGLFIGLQVDDWNQNRQADAREATYLELIYDDALAMRDDLLGIIERKTERINWTSAAITALDNCDDSQAARENISRAIGVYQQGRGVQYIGSTYEEMLSSGSLARISDEELKRAISNAFAATMTLNESYFNVRLSIPVVDAIVWDRVTITPDPVAGRMQVDFDLAELCTDKVMKNAMVEMLDIHLDGRAFSRQTVESVEQLLAKLSASGVGALPR